VSTLLRITTLKHTTLGSCIVYLQTRLVRITQILFITQLIYQVNNYLYIYFTIHTWLYTNTLISPHINVPSTVPENSSHNSISQQMNTALHSFHGQ